MKKILFLIALVICAAAVSPRIARAENNQCNQKCDVDTDCGSGYRCYVGVCRLDLCPASSSCSCASIATATPVATARPSASPAATLKPTTIPKPAASIAAKLKTSPKTGVSPLGLGLLALGAYCIGAQLYKQARA